jgi:hypothetical protein
MIVAGWQPFCAVKSMLLLLGAKNFFLALTLFNPGSRQPFQISPTNLAKTILLPHILNRASRRPFFVFNKNSTLLR